MKKLVSAGISVLFLAMPLVAAAETNTATLTPLYVQLVNFLQEELALLQHPGQSVLVAQPTYGRLPLSVLFTLVNPKSGEVITFGDGVYAGGNACIKNPGATCDLSLPIAHTYTTPGTYTVNLYTYPQGQVQTLSTTTVVVTQ